MRYRADIDGLRAVAVLSVILYHAKFSLFPGGFVGVDVFFVLSGFLITGIIKADLESNRFSFLTFFERRVRRIFPILLTVITTVTAMGLVIFTYNEYQYISRGTIASLFFVQNIALFRSQGDYFAPTSEQNPLLHLWSLSIEEQFYVFYPALLFMLWRHWRRYLPFALAAIAVGSLVWAEFKVRSTPSATFFLTQYRVWELLVGGMIHFLPTSRKLPQMLREIVAFSGLASICYPVFFYNAQTVFPGIAALLPTLGTAAVIASGTLNPTIVSRLLSIAPFTWVGGMSYGLYLWHWPLLSIAEAIAFVEIGVTHRLVLIATAFILSWLSLRFLETPFRSKQFIFSRKKLFGGVALVALLLVATTSVTRTPTGWIGATLGVDEWDDLDPRCITEVCRTGAKNPTLALIGDSHAGHMRRTLSKWDVNLGYQIQTGCPPLYGINPKYDNEAPLDCNTVKKLETLEKERTIKTVVIAGRWQVYYDGRVADVGKKDRSVDLCNETGCAHSDERRHQLFFQGLFELTSKLKAQGKDVIILGALPSPGFHVPRALRLVEWLPLPAPQWKLTVQDNRSFAQLEAVLDEVANKSRVKVFHPRSIFCEETCQYASSQTAYFYDTNHLSRAGADLVWKVLTEGPRAPAQEKE